MTGAPQAEGVQRPGTSGSWACSSLSNSIGSRQIVTDPRSTSHMASRACSSALKGAPYSTATRVDQVVGAFELCVPPGNRLHRSKSSPSEGTARRQPSAVVISYQLIQGGPVGEGRGQVVSGLIGTHQLVKATLKASLEEQEAIGIDRGSNPNVKCNASEVTGPHLAPLRARSRGV